MLGKAGKAWSRGLSAAVFLLLLAASATFCQYRAQKRAESAILTLQNFADHISLSLQRGFNYTDELAAVLSLKDGSVYFEETAARLAARPAFLYAEYWRGGILAKVFPPEYGGQQALGTKLEEADYAYTLAKMVNILTVEGPLRSGNREVFLVIQPLYTTMGTSVVFSGEAVVALDCQQVLESFQLEKLVNSGYEYELWGVHPLDGSKRRIAVSSEGVDFSQAIETKFKLPTIWSLSILPTGGWFNWDLMAALAVCSGLVAAGFALLLSTLRRKNALERGAILASRYDRETNFITRERLLELLRLWTATPGEPFILLYVTLNDYGRIAQLCTPDQKTGLLEHITSCLSQYVRNEHLVARVGEAHFVLAFKDASSPIELDNMRKGLAIELIQKIVLDGEKLFLEADCQVCRFPCDESDPEALLQLAINRHLEQNQ